MTRTRWIWVSLVAITLGSAARADVVRNGTNLNGTNLNGTNLNGTNLNGTNLNGTSFAGVSLRGAALHDVHLDGSQLVARRGNSGQTLAGADLIGAQLSGALDNGATLVVRIDDVTRNDDIYHYRVAYARGDGSWGALCTDAAGNASDAIPLAGRWSYQQGAVGGGAHIDDAGSFTFACAGGAIAKCVEWGYKPWASVGGVSLAAAHQTCTRVVRADYCGDGVSHTQDGQVINLYDHQGVQRDTRPWLGEASWDVDGARAYNLLNRSHLDLIYRLSCNVPLRLLFDADWEFAHDAVIIDETPLGSDL
jgi:hypothetical protein